MARTGGKRHSGGLASQARVAAGAALVRAVGAVAARGGEEFRRQLASAAAGYPLWVPPGHFYSPLPDLEAVRRQPSPIPTGPALPGIDLREPEQWDLLERLAPLYADIPFPREPEPGWRFHFENPMYPYGDAVVLFCLLRHLVPSRVIEVGAGYSTALMVDTADRLLERPLDLTLVEPFPQRVESLLGSPLPPGVRLIRQGLEEVDVGIFEALGPGDVLFVDSTHVAKARSDVLLLFFEVLPRLAPGVHVHVHDVFFPFDYPQEWVLEGRAWNEAYFLRAFLQHNEAFEIVLFPDMLLARDPSWFRRHMPLCLEVRQAVSAAYPGFTRSAQSIWLRRR